MPAQVAAVSFTLCPTWTGVAGQGEGGGRETVRSLEDSSVVTEASDGGQPWEVKQPGQLRGPNKVSPPLKCLSPLRCQPHMCQALFRHYLGITLGIFLWNLMAKKTILRKTSLW